MNFIFCGGMQRSGSTLQYQIASELIERLELGRRTTYYPPDRHAEVLTALTGAGLTTFKTHDLTHVIQAFCSSSRAVALYIYRDVRDAISSLQQKNGSVFNERQIETLARRLLRTDSQWRVLPRVHIARYENVVADVLNEVERTADFLQLKCPHRLANDIARDLSYESQVARIDAASMSGLVEMNTGEVYDRFSLLHRDHLQSGRVGRYRIDLDDAQISVIESVAADWLRSNEYMT